MNDKKSKHDPMRALGRKVIPGVMPTDGLKSVYEQAAAQDARRQLQVGRQVEIINGLQDQLRDAKSEIWAQQITIYCLVQMFNRAAPVPGSVVITKKDLVAAPGGMVEATNDVDGNLIIRITKEEEEQDG